MFRQLWGMGPFFLGAYLVLAFTLSVLLAVRHDAGGSARPTAPQVAYSEGSPGAPVDLAPVADVSSNESHDVLLLTILFFVAILVISGVALVSVVSFVQWLRA